MAEPLAQSLSELATVAKAIIQSGFFPDAKNESQALVKMMWGHELGIGPMSSQGIWVIETRKGPSLRLSGELMGALIKRAPGWDYTYTLTDDRCEITVTYENKVRGITSFTTKEAVAAGLCSLNPQGKPVRKSKSGEALPWEAYHKDLLWNRAMTRTKRICGHLFYGLGVQVLDADEADLEPMTQDQRAALMIWSKDRGMDRQGRLAWSSDVLDRDVLSWAREAPSPVTEAEARILLAAVDAFDESATAGEPVPQVSPEDSTGEGVMPASNAGDGSAAWSPVDPEPATDVPGGAGATKGQGTQQAPTPPAPTPEPSTLDVLMREYEDLLASGKRPKIIVTSWLASFLSEEKLPSMEHADEEQAKRGLTWFQMQFRNWRAA
jgi:hypothetical protein